MKRGGKRQGLTANVWGEQDQRGKGAVTWAVSRKGRVAVTLRRG